MKIHKYSREHYHVTNCGLKCSKVGSRSKYWENITCKNCLKTKKHED